MGYGSRGVAENTHSVYKLHSYVSTLLWLIFFCFPSLSVWHASHELRVDFIHVGAHLD